MNKNNLDAPATPDKWKEQQMKMRIIWLAVLMVIPCAALAQPHKCKNPDGSTTYQDQPCPESAVSEQIVAPRVSINTASDSESKDAGASRAARMHEIDRMRAEKEAQARYQEMEEYNRKVVEHNRAQRCNQARQQLSVLKQAVPVYTVDDNGERHYIENDDRAAQIAAAQERVAEACK